MTHSTSERRHATLPPLPALLRVASFHTLCRVNDQDTMFAHPQERGDVLPGCQPWHVIGWRQRACVTASPLPLPLPPPCYVLYPNCEK